MGLHKYLLSGTGVRATLADVRRAEAVGSVRGKWTARKVARQSERIGQLEADVGYLVLLLGSVLQKLNSKGVVTKAELRNEMSALDDLDGVRDGRFDISLLRRFGDDAS